MTTRPLMGVTKYARWAWLCAACVASLASASCSLIINSDQYVGTADPCDGCLGDCVESGSEEVCCDRDGDGFNAADVPTECGDSTESDCNDENAAVFPGAGAVCGDGVINDCNASTVPPQFQDLAVDEYEQVPPLPIADFQATSDDALDVDAVALPANFVGESLGVLFAFVRPGGTLSVGLVGRHPNFRELDYTVPVVASGAPEDVQAVALGTFNGVFYAALYFFDAFAGTSSITLNRVTVGEFNGSELPVQVTEVARYDLSDDQPPGVEFGTVFVSDERGGEVVEEAAAVFPVTHGVCRLAEGGTDVVCDPDSGEWSFPTSTRASQWLSADQSHDTLAGRRTQLILNSGDDYRHLSVTGLVELNTVTGDPGGWDISFLDGDPVLAVPMRFSSGALVRMIRFPCSGTSVNACDFDAISRSNIPNLPQTEIARTTPFAAGLALATVEFPSGAAAVTLRQLELDNDSERFIAKEGLVPFNPPPGTGINDVTQLEISTVDQSHGRSLGFVYLGSNTSGGNNDYAVFVGGLQTCTDR